MSEFTTYAGSLPSAGAIAPTHTLMILQNNQLYQVTVSSLLSNAPVPIDCTLGTVATDINGLSDVILTKIDGTANIATISDSSGKTIEGLAQYRDGLQGQYETVHLSLVGTNWIKVGGS